MINALGIASLVSVIALVAAGSWYQLGGGAPANIAMRATLLTTVLLVPVFVVCAACRGVVRAIRLQRSNKWGHLVTCPTCGGKGKHCISIHPAGNALVTCGLCDGRGLVSFKQY